MRPARAHTQSTCIRVLYIFYICKSVYVVVFQRVVTDLHAALGRACVEHKVMAQRTDTVCELVYELVCTIVCKIVCD